MAVRSDSCRGVTSLLGLGTALPRHSGTQSQVARFMSRVLEASLPSNRRELALSLVDTIYSTSGIDRRHSVLSDFCETEPAAFRFFPPNWELEPFPSTAARMAVYERESVGLCQLAATRALTQAGVQPEDVSHLLVCTCTGFFAPGPDILLLERLGLRRTVKRETIGFMGCYAGFNGLRGADQIVRGDPDAVVLQICVELCTLHFQKKATPDLIVANCLFADGCSAAVYGSPAAAGPGLARVLTSQCHVDGDSLDQMTWRVGDTGFEMRLAPTVPETLGLRSRAFVDSLLAEAGLSQSQVGAWALHPGGRKIVEVLAEALALESAELKPALGVLRDCGNMSSATIFFVLERLLGGAAGTGPVVALGFGPGLTMEGAVLNR